MLGGGSEGYFPAFQLPGVDFSLMASVELGEVSSLPVTAASEKQMQPLQQLSTKEKQLGEKLCPAAKVTNVKCVFHAGVAGRKRRRQRLSGDPRGT